MEAQLSSQIAKIYFCKKCRYGSPRIHHALRESGTLIGRRRVARIMRINGWFARGKKRYVKTTDSNHQHPVAENILNRNFTAKAPNQKWVGDITYIWTRDGWLYLAVLLDLFSRRVVGWSLSRQIDRALALSALNMAITNRSPCAGLLHHTDRGCQYASDDYQEALKHHQMVCSMSRKGNCWDNSVSESFFSTLKEEVADIESGLPEFQVRSMVFEYIEVFYNRNRAHSTLGYLSPVAYEEKMAGKTCLMTLAA
jgi:transposase InsO family protein